MQCNLLKKFETGFRPRDFSSSNIFIRIIFIEDNKKNNRTFKKIE